MCEGFRPNVFRPGSLMSPPNTQSVERAIQLAQEAVKADEAGDIEEAVRLYLQSVGLIKEVLYAQRDEEVVDSTVLEKYSQLYTERITELSRSLLDDQPHSSYAASSGVSGDTARSASNPGGACASAAGAGATTTASAVASIFTFDDSEIEGATPPRPAPAGPEEWRRPFWLMRILRTTMMQGGYLSSDGRIFVPRRVWVQKGARFTAMAAKADCAQCLVTEFGRAKTTDYYRPEAVLKELDKLSDTLDALQNSLARLLPYVPEPRSSEAANNAMSKLAERFKGLAKTLDKTAARLGAMPTKCPDPTEYISSLVAIFDEAMFLETWMEHYTQPSGHHPEINDRLHRCASFLYEVVCAFVIQDLDALVQRHMRKASAAFVSGAADGAE